MNNRILIWDGCKNVRDLGGLRTMDGHMTRFGEVIRGGTPSTLTPDGWSALHDYGVRHIISLRTHGMVEPELDVTSPYRDIAVLNVEIEDITDAEFLDKWAKTDLWSTPMYYKDALLRWPKRHAEAVTTIARAEPGVVLFHCIRGNDRTGIITLLLLTLVGVTPEEILADYELSPDPERQSILDKVNATIREAVLGALDGVDVEGYLLAGGCSRADLASIRRRLVE